MTNTKTNRLQQIKEFREKMRSGQPSIGSWMQIPHASVAEIMGQSGYDWVAVDLEHGAISVSQLPDLFRALELGGTLPLARIAQAALKDCKGALDAGAAGVILPMIQSAEELQQAVDFSRWPPAGIRGVGYSRANLFGKNFDSYKEEAIAPLIIAQIEHIDAVKHLSEILSVEALDATIIGPYDLSASMGLTGQFEHPEFLDVLKEISELSRKHKLPQGIHVVQPEPVELQQRIQEGYQFIAYSIDAVFLYHSSEKPVP